MSVDKAIRDMIRDEIEAAIAPLHAAVAQMQNQGGVLAQLSAVLGGQKRGPGRPPNPFKLGRPAALKTGGGRRRTRAGNGQNDRACALIGCRRPSRSKGYCAAHYQKYRSLERTGRLPGDWKDFAPPNSVKDVILPRGRAGAKALAEAKKK
ncbi:MAG: cell wall protein [Archangiaceae bacterium]|nr:cell wall protein [Archangiaceae bacterium]